MSPEDEGAADPGRAPAGPGEVAADSRESPGDSPVAAGGGADGPLLSAIVVTLNEGDRLERCLGSVSWCDEIVVVDSGSTDDTGEVARRFTDRFFVREWPGMGRQKERARRLARGRWVLSLDADEVVSPELRASMQAALRAPGPFVAFEVDRTTRYLGHVFGRRGWWRDRLVRLFRRDRGRFSDDPVHAAVRVDGPVGRLEGPLYHDSYRDVEHHLEKMNAYTSEIARNRHRAGVRSGPVGALLRGAVHFLKNYLVRGGFLDGRAGFAYATLGAIYACLKYLKIWEIERTGGSGGGGEPHPPDGEGRRDAGAGGGKRREGDGGEHPGTDG